MWSGWWPAPSSSSEGGRAFPLNELRISGTLQGVIIALVVGTVLPRFGGADGGGSWLVAILGFLAMTYASLAATLTWLLGGLDDLAISPPYIGVVAVITGIAFGVSGGWLATSPYPKLAWFSLAVMGFWVILFLLSVGRWAIKRDIQKKTRG